MITIVNALTAQGLSTLIEIKSTTETTIDCKNRLVVLPAGIDGHVHFRTPGDEGKEDWMHGAAAAIAGGVTTVFDMPNNSPACTSQPTLNDKIGLIDKQLAEAKIPLRYHLYLGAHSEHLDEVPKVKDRVIGLKIFMGSTTGDLLMNDRAAMTRAFQVAAENDLIVSVHAECEEVLKRRSEGFAWSPDPKLHSQVRDRYAAIKACKQAIDLASRAGAKLAILHLSTAEEIDLVRQAKKAGLPVYAEITPHHLFLNESAYEQQGTFVQMNPPLRTQKDQDALWEGIHDGTVDMIGSDHAPHTMEEKALPYGKAPSGVPGVETTLPLLLNASNNGLISLAQIQALTRTNIERIFGLPSNNDVVIIDMDLEKTVNNRNLKTKCKWSPYSGLDLKGWPVTTVCKGKVFNLQPSEVAAGNG
jgi:dihydroorotase